MSPDTRAMRASRQSTHLEANPPDPYDAGMTAAWQVAKAFVGLPFDALREQRANAVRAGLVRNSMLASRDFEHALAALERMTLGPLARSV
jgi:hypothetical protein